jgi:hypothetical protein
MFCMQHCKEKYNIVLLSFTIHHLGLEAKAQLLQQVRGVLAPGGRLYVMDIFKRCVCLISCGLSAFHDMSSVVDGPGIKGEFRTLGIAGI